MGPEAGERVAGEQFGIKEGQNQFCSPAHFWLPIPISEPSAPGTI